MTQALTPTERAAAETDNVPPLVNGDHLTREEFHRRYEAMGEGTRAELIEGIVYVYNDGMGSPVSNDKHAQPHFDLITWAGIYAARTPGLLRGADGTVFADLDNEAQPDVMLGIPETKGGQTRTAMINGKRYIANAPEFVAEITASTASIDLNAKLRAYQRNGVLEYLVVLTEVEPAELRWLVLENGRFERIDLDDGLFKSRVFPGLWLDPVALLNGDAAGLMDGVTRGCAEDSRREAFLAQLAG
ncbi:MAG: Uma2 family endonuclease [Planctomycetota bacterium]